MQRAWIGVGLACLALTFSSSPAAAEKSTIKGWLIGGTDLEGYAIGTETEDGGTVAYIRSIDPAPGGNGLIFQALEAEGYRGKRFRLSARIRTEDVAELAVMWMRADRDQQIVSLDNMMDRPIEGTTGWRRYTIVFDVPEQCDTVMFGLGLSGTGKAVWDDVSFEEVGPDVPVTGRSVLHGPSNLDFSR